MPHQLSKTKIDNLGNRLRSSPATQDDLILLEAFRLSFESAYEYVVDQLRELKLAPTGRPAKSTPSVIAKLNRESIRLSQMQDIAGCRVVVDSMAQQNRVTDAVQAVFRRCMVFDRRAQPSHGYRAVHLVVFTSGMPVEVQVRTTLQHAWAELSEKLADILNPTVKYGGGPKTLRTALDKLSELVQNEEDSEHALHLLREADSGGQLDQRLQQMEDKFRERKLKLHEACRELILELETTKK